MTPAKRYTDERYTDEELEKLRAALVPTPLHKDTHPAYARLFATIDALTLEVARLLAERDRLRNEAYRQGMRDAKNG